MALFLCKPLLRTLLAAAVLVTGATAAKVSHAETQLFQPENYNAWIDVRAVATDGERGWLKGGFGKLRYDSGNLNVAQAALLWKPRLLDTVTAYVLVQDVPDAETPFGVEEAYVKWKPVPTSDLRYSLRAGQMFPPVSMEHDGVGWTPSRTITPSAINSWIGEEVLVRGLEGNVQKSFGAHTVGLTAGVFSRDDTAGTLLSWRGWALHDISSADNTGLPLSDGDNQGWYQLFDDDQADLSKPMVELDHRLGYYVRLDWRPPVPAAFNLEFYDNRGDPEVERNGQWGWATRFYNLGVQYNPAPGFEVLAQYMRGHTQMGWELSDGTWSVDADFDSAYVLLSHKRDNGDRFTGRVDYFAVKDHSKRTIDDNTDKGYSATVAYIRPLNAHLDLAFEALQVHSNHPARVTHDLAAHQSQTQIQLALKVHL